MKMEVTMTFTVNDTISYRCPNKYGTDLMQRRVCMRVRGVLLALLVLESARDTTRECEGYYSRVQIKLLASIKLFETLLHRG